MHTAQHVSHYVRSGSAAAESKISIFHPDFLVCIHFSDYIRGARLPIYKTKNLVRQLSALVLRGTQTPQEKGHGCYQENFVAGFEAEANGQHQVDGFGHKKPVPP